MAVMRKFRKFRKGRGAPKKGKVSRSTAAASLTKAQKAQVNHMINNTEQTRYIAEQILNSRDGGYVNFNSQVTTAADWYRCLPLIAQSTASNNRTGNIVVPTKTLLHFEMRFSTSDIQSRDVYVVLYVLNCKSLKQYSTSAVNGQLATDNLFAEYLKNGADQVTNFAGTWTNSTFPINDKSFSLITKKVIHLNQSSGDPNGAGVIDSYSALGQGKYSVSGDFQKTLTISIPTPKLKYSKASDTVPNNFAPVWAAGYYYTNGTAPDTLGGLLAISCRTEMWFKSD